MLLGYFFFFFLQTWNKEKNHKPTQPKNHAFFSHWTGAKEERGRKWGGYAKHQNVQWSKWEIFKPKQQLSARILTLPKKLFHAQKHTEQERGILTKMTWTSSVFSPAGDFQASRMWRKIKKPLNSKGMWGSDGVLVICWYYVIVKDEEIILRTTCSRKSFLIPLSKVPDGTRNPFWGKSPCKQRRFYHLSQIHFLAHCHFQIFPQK